LRDVLNALALPCEKLDRFHPDRRQLCASLKRAAPQTAAALSDPCYATITAGDGILTEGAPLTFRERRQEQASEGVQLFIIRRLDIDVLRFPLKGRVGPRPCR